jgi:ribosomal protein L16 Arg81 hydroxylase
MLEDLLPQPGYLDPKRMLGAVSLWYGPAGTVTPLHYDTSNILFCQVSGRKRFKLISPLYTELLHDTNGYYSLIDAEKPDPERFPYFRDVELHEVEVAAGEALFIPATWWHHVRGLEPSLSLSLLNFVFPNLFESRNPYTMATPTLLEHEREMWQPPEPRP